MRRCAGLLALLLPLAFWSSCADDQPTTEARVLQADQIRPVLPNNEVEKAAQVDIDGQFALQVLPWRTVTLNQPGFQLRAPRGCVDRPGWIWGDWCGDDPVDPCVGHDFGPDGAEFDQPLEVQYFLSAQQLQGIDPDFLVFVLDREDGTYEEVSGTWIESCGQGVRIHSRIDHFSKYLVAVGPPPDNTTNR